MQDNTAQPESGTHLTLIEPEWEARIPRSLLFRAARTLGPGATTVWMALWSMKNAASQCYPHESTLGVELGMNERTIRRHVRYLRKAGWITVKRTQRGNLYTVVESPPDDPPEKAETGHKCPVREDKTVLSERTQTAARSSSNEVAPKKDSRRGEPPSAPSQPSTVERAKTRWHERDYDDLTDLQFAACAWRDRYSVYRDGPAVDLKAPQAGACRNLFKYLRKVNADSESTRDHYCRIIDKAFNEYAVGRPERAGAVYAFASHVCAPSPLKIYQHIDVLMEADYAEQRKVNVRSIPYWIRSAVNTRQQSGDWPEDLTPDQIAQCEPYKEVDLWA